MDASYYIDKIDLIKYLEKSGYVLDKDKSSVRQQVYSNNCEKLLVLRHKKTGKLIYQNLNDPKDKGNIINYVVNRINGYLSTDSKLKSDYAKAFALLDEHAEGKLLYQDIQVFQEKVRFEYELYAPHELSDFSFLLSRRILLSTLLHPLFKGSIVNCYKYGFKTRSNYGEVMTGFPSIRNREVVGLEIRGKNEKKMALGSEVVDSFWVSNYFKKHEGIIISENPIDNLSYFQTKGDLNCTHIASFGSISDKQCERLYRLIDSSIYKKIILINDNDFGGCNNDLKIISRFIEAGSLKIVKAEKNYISLEYNKDLYEIRDNTTYKWFLSKLIFNNGLENIIFMDKSDAKDWNATLC